MVIDQESLIYINKVANLAKSIGIEELIIEPGKVRAIDADRSIFILHTDNVPDMSFGTIGLSRLDIFQTRLNIAKTFSNCTIEATIANDDKPFVRSITMKAKGFKVDFRCANPQTIQAPKAYKGDKMFDFSVSPTIIDILTKGASAMKSDTVLLKGKDGIVEFEIEDINGDIFAYSMSDNLLVSSDSLQTGFSYRYPIKSLTQILKQDKPNIDISISSKGILNLQSSDLDLYLFPRT